MGEEPKSLQGENFSEAARAGRRRRLFDDEAGEPHVCTCGYGPDGCGCAVGWADRCRFEEALRDPVDAQLDAALGVLAEFTRLPYGPHEHGGPQAAAVVAGVPDAQARNREAMGRVLAAAAAVVLGREPCAGCGRPKGTGTLLDFRPTPPLGGVVSGDGGDVPLPDELARQMIGQPSVEMWREFAARYRCPACAEASIADVVKGNIDADPYPDA